MNLNEDSIHRELLHTHLTSLGNYYGLEIFFDSKLMQKQLEPFSQDWKHYNPRKAHIPRYGLSLTSLDGGLSGRPDLDSIAEYNKQHSTALGDESFTVQTEVLKNVSAIRDPIKPFLPHLGRSHLLKFDDGGYFPFHRDSQWFGAKTFRLVSLLDNCDPNSFTFLYDNQRIFLNPYQLYFMNTKMTHALFSFANNATLLVLSVLLNEQSAERVCHHLIAR